MKVTGIEIPKIGVEKEFWNPHYHFMVGTVDGIFGHIKGSTRACSARSLDGKIEVSTEHMQNAGLLLWMALRIRELEQKLAEREANDERG